MQELLRPEIRISAAASRFLAVNPLLLMLSCRDECCHDSHLPLQAHMQHQQIIHSQILVMLLPSYLVPCRSFGISQHQASC